MRNQILLTAFLLLGLGASAQTKVTKDANGNYQSIQKADTADRFTGHTFIDNKHKEWPVYLSKKDKMYYLRTSKAGNKYKVYIKEEK